jgi:tRNA threonylcarbamoyladenosine biosynthesis protein TsaE
MKLISRSSQETKKAATQLAKKIIKSSPHKKHARVVALVGDLGAGKTTFVQGFAKALGIKHRMVSPTFLIFRNYELRIKNYEFFYHVDLYRIESPKELDVINFKEALANPKNIMLIEWAEKIKKILPKDTIWVNFTHGRKETERIIAY